MYGKFVRARDVPEPLLARELHSPAPAGAPPHCLQFPLHPTHVPSQTHPPVPQLDCPHHVLALHVHLPAHAQQGCTESAGSVVRWAHRRLAQRQSTKQGQVAMGCGNDNAKQPGKHKPASAHSMLTTTLRPDPAYECNWIPESDSDSCCHRRPRTPHNYRTGCFGMQACLAGGCSQKGYSHCTQAQHQSS